MKYSSKVIVFIATAAITFGTLAATVGRHRHQWKGKHMHGCYEGRGWQGHHGGGRCDGDPRDGHYRDGHKQDMRGHGPGKQQVPPPAAAPVPADSAK